MRSARLTPTLWYVGILGVILCLFSVLFYLNVATNLARDVDKTLVFQADGVAETIFAFWRAERAAAGSGPGNWSAAPSDTFDEEINQGGLPALLSRWAEKTGNLDTERPTRLIDKSGQSLGASPSFTQLALPLTDAMIPEAQQRSTVYQTFTLPDRRIRLVTRPVLANRRALYYVQVASSLRAMDTSLARLRWLLLILIPTMIVSIRAVGMVLATKAFAPIRNIIGRAQQFMEDSLHEPLDIPRTSDEVEQLDRAFDEMVTRVERAFRRLRQFSAAASHELRTPLTVMKGEIGVALRKPRSVDEYQRVLRTQLEAVDEMARTVEKLLAVAHREAAEGETEWHPLDLSALARRAGETFTPIAKARKVQVKVATPEPVWVRGESLILERLISNLLENAVKHTPAKGQVTILTRSQEHEAYLAIQDTGAGIPPEELPHLFDRFFHRRPSVDGSQSTGLGLGLCRWIVETHHGSLDVSSAPQGGTTVTVRFPLFQFPA